MLDESFADTAQPSTSIWYLENGFQTSVAVWRRSLYAGHESVEGAVSGARQAEQLGAALRLAYCRPRVTAYFNFLLIDEPSLDRRQSGLLWADWRPKPSFAAYRAAITDVRAGAVTCAGGGGAGRRRRPRSCLRPSAARLQNAVDAKGVRDVGRLALGRLVVGHDGRHYVVSRREQSP